MSSTETVQLAEDLYLVPIQTEDHLHLLRLMRRIYLPVYHHLWKDSGDWYLKKTYCETNLSNELADEKGQYFFVIQVNKPVGVLRIRRATPLIDFSEEPAMKLHRVYLDPSAQGQGIGKKIIDWSVEQAQKIGAKILWLEAMATHEPALQFYKKHGFEICGHFDFSSDQMRPEYRAMVRMYKEVS